VNRRLALLIILLAAAFGAYRGAVSSSVSGDFLRYHRAGRLVATGRADLVYDHALLDAQGVYADERVPGGDKLYEREFKYAPALAVMMAPLGAMPPRAANIVWDAWNQALVAAMIVALWSWCGDGVSKWWALVPIVALIRPLDSNVRLGQINLTAIVPATVGVWLLARGRDRLAGALVGLGTVVKFMPGVLVLWFAAKRRWTALLACVGTVALLGVALPAVVLGPSRSTALTNEWLAQRSHYYTEAASPDLPGFSVKSFVYRTLGDVPFVTFDRDTGERKEVHVGGGALPPDELRLLALALDGIVLAAALWFARGALGGADDPRGPLAASLMFVAMPLVSPEARFPHFAYLALPATALTCAFVRGGLASTRRRVAAALSVVGVLAMYATSSKPWILLGLGERAALLVEAWCVPGWGALAIGAAVVLVLSDLEPARA
jgi:hypothetical protein